MDTLKQIWEKVKEPKIKLFITAGVLVLSVFLCLTRYWGAPWTLYFIGWSLLAAKYWDEFQASTKK